MKAILVGCITSFSAMSQIPPPPQAPPPPLPAVIAPVPMVPQTHFEIQNLAPASEKSLFKPMSTLDWEKIEKQASRLKKYRGPVEVGKKDFPGEFAKGFFVGAFTGTEVKKPAAYLYMATPRLQLVDEVAKKLKLAEPFDREFLAKKYAGANTFYLAVDASGQREAFIDGLLGLRAIRKESPIEKIFLKTKAGVVQPLKIDGDRYYFPLDVIPENRWNRVYAVIVDREGASLEMDISGQVMVNNDME